MKDFGYDISDYCDVDPIFGTLADLEELFKIANSKGIKIILDFVPNHSSEEHEWFQKSIKREGKYTDYYIWADGRNNNTEPPNNWLSIFHGPAWTFVKERNQWYYHTFGKTFAQNFPIPRFCPCFLLSKHVLLQPKSNRI